MTVSDSEPALEPVEGAFPVNLSNTTQVQYSTVLTSEGYLRFISQILRRYITVQCKTLQCIKVQYSTVHYSTVQYCTVKGHFHFIFQYYAGTV